MMSHMNFKLQALGSSTSWHWPIPLAKGGCLDSKSICPRSSQQSTQKFFLGFLLLLCTLMVKDQTSKQSNTKTKYITQYGPNGQSENCININN